MAREFIDARCVGLRLKQEWRKAALRPSRNRTSFKSWAGKEEASNLSRQKTHARIPPSQEKASSNPHSRPAHVQLASQCLAGEVGVGADPPRKSHSSTPGYA
jgi:hypothetical protein